MLSPYRVIDLTDGRAEHGPLILAGLGADVIKVEPPGGSAARREAPLDAALPDGLQSLRFHAFNRGKRSVVLDLERADGREGSIAWWRARISCSRTLAQGRHDGAPR